MIYRIIILFMLLPCRIFGQVVINMSCHPGNGGEYPDITLITSMDVDFIRRLDARYLSPIDSIENMNGRTACFKAVKPGSYLFYAGTYDERCVIMSEVYEVRQPVLFYLAPIPASSSCTNVASRIRVVRRGGAVPCTYNLIDSSDNSILQTKTSSDPVSFTDLGYGKYYIEAVDAAGCKAISHIQTIKKNYGDVTVKVLEATGSCGDNNGFIKASAIGNLNFKFVFELSGKNYKKNSLTGEFNDLLPGSYTLKATEMTYGCESVNHPTIQINQSKAGSINLNVKTEIP